MINEQDYYKLQQTVTNLLVRIEENQQIQARFHDYEFQLLGCRRLPELLEQLIAGAEKHFDLVAASIVVHDPDYAFEVLAEHLSLGDYQNRLQIHHTDEFFSSLYHRSPAVILGPLKEEIRERLFPRVNGIASAALMPLMRQQRVIGSLHFASDLPDRYSADKAVSFMWHLASMAAICLEDCIALEQLQRQRQEDILTRVRNRRSFEEEFVKELERAERQWQPLSCMFVDIDHFKKINDSYGHQVGDHCLRQVARLIGDEFRKTDLLARYGGEEFVALLPNCPSEEARFIAERVRQTVMNNPLVIDDQTIPVTVSVGSTTWQPGGGRVGDLQALGEQLLSTADRSMYRAKQSGRNQVAVEPFNPAVQLADA